MPQTVRTVEVDDVGAVSLTVEEDGDRGQTCLLLHPGAGPEPMLGFGGMLASRGMRVLVPTHPGFNGTDRPEGLATVRDLARLYAAYLAVLRIGDVVVIGNSIGGWIATELGLLHSPWVGRLVLVDSVGFDDPANPEADTRPMTAEELISIAFHDPGPALQAISNAPESQRQRRAANNEVNYSYTPQRTDPTLAGRLSELGELPVLLLWGESDGVVTPAAGRSFASAIPGAEFRLLEGTGHMPEVETPELLYDAIFGDVAKQGLPAYPIQTGGNL
ncbi:MAG TPA: alpha/beta hydrolase [Solirubrobacteraceae bacterium]|nr:alpha/beta hydrolase [Solirubrobacteraceae bacterium]